MSIIPKRMMVSYPFYRGKNRKVHRAVRDTIKIQTQSYLLKPALTAMTQYFLSSNFYEPEFLSINWR